MLSWTRVTSVDRKSTRLNSSHLDISYAVFCLKKKNKLNHGGPEELAKIRREAQSHQVSLAANTYTLLLHPLLPISVLMYMCDFLFFFFNDSGAPRVFPFSPPRRFPN